MFSGYSWYNKDNNNEKYHYTNENELPENWKSFQLKLDDLIFKEMY
jgi:hypothetical protein